MPPPPVGPLLLSNPWKAARPPRPPNGNMGDEEEAALEEDEVEDDEPDEVDDEGMLESAGADGILLAAVLPLTCILFYYTNFFKKNVSCLSSTSCYSIATIKFLTKPPL